MARPRFARESASAVTSRALGGSADGHSSRRRKTPNLSEAGEIALAGIGEDRLGRAPADVEKERPYDQIQHEARSGWIDVRLFLKRG